MFSIFDVIGVMLRGAAALGFAAVCGWSSIFFENGQQARLAVFGQWFGAGGPIVLIALGGLAIAAGFYCMISLSRETKRRHAMAAVTQGQDDFDPDAIIARHVAWRKANPPAAARRPRSGFHRAAPRRDFGRRIA